VAHYQDITYAVQDGVATITIDRPSSLNAFTGQTLQELGAAFGDAGRDHDVGVIVLTGTGDRSFCAGGDINWEASGDFVETGPDVEMKRLYTAMRAQHKPIIARVNGYAIGGGNHLAYFCDFTVAADHAVFGQNGPRVGSPAQGWIVSYLVRVIGAKRAREMWLFCDRYDANRMLDWGLVNAVVPFAELDAEVRRWCDKVLALSPTVIKLVKHTFDEEWAPLRESQADDYLDVVNPQFYDSGEQQEGANAFLEKRSPQFSPWR
jgi:dihydroxynaphthoic acid synthetase